MALFSHEPWLTEGFQSALAIYASLLLFQIFTDLSLVLFASIQIPILEISYPFKPLEWPPHVINAKQMGDEN